MSTSALQQPSPSPSPSPSLEARLEALISELEKTDPNAGSHRFHIKRYLTSLSFLPDKPAKVLDLGGALGLFSEVLKETRPYRVYYGDISGGAGRPLDFDRDSLPYESGSFDLVLFMEVLEHLREDPMNILFEINRVLKPNGAFFLTTPNIASWKAIRRALNRENPALFAPYLRHGGTDRHNREYTFDEVIRLVGDAGFNVASADALDIYDHVPGAEAVPGFDPSNRGDTTFCFARKVSAGVTRRPGWLYWPAE